MSRRRNQLMLFCAAHDKTFELGSQRDAGWQGKCIHCQRKVLLRRDGKPHSGSTLEHIWPRSKGGSDHPDNLAIACSRCNSQKGRKIDILDNDDPRLIKVVNSLKKRKSDRLRHDISHLPADLLWVITNLLPTAPDPFNEA